jgi:hypothetical protein
MDISDAVRRYSAGDGLESLAASMGVGYSTASRRLLNAGVELRRPGRPRAKARRQLPPVPRIRLAGPRAARRGRTGGTTPAEDGGLPAFTEVLDQLRAGLHAMRDEHAPPPELDDYHLQVIQEGLAILAGKEPVVDANGNVRGVRRRPDGTIERF